MPRGEVGGWLTGFWGVVQYFCSSGVIANGMKRIEHLKKGDRVALAAPARAVSPEEMGPAIAMLEGWGLQVVVPEGLYEREGQLAGSDSHRAALMQQLLDDDTVKAILCCRGGYGTVRIVDRLDFSHFAQRPKWVVGYSDITVLHSHIHSLFGLPTLHATMPINITTDAFANNYPATDTLREALFGEKLEYSCKPHQLNRKGTAEGVLVGGNLSILYSLCGSKSEIDTTNKILFIEDLDEYLYHIDRMMMNLKRNGMFDHLLGLVVGQLSDMHDNTIKFGKTAEEIVSDCVKEYSFPVSFDFPAGHNGLYNHAMILGRPVTLEVGHETRLQWKA
jgi:muramoyltetrapeptide carboxypeptidase